MSAHAAFGRVRGWPALLLVLLLAVPAGAQQDAPFWSQLGGGPGHPNVARHLVHELDVQLTGRLTLDGETLGALYALGLVETRHGLSAIVANETRGECELITFEPSPTESFQPLRGRPFACPHAFTSAEGTGVVAYDVANDAVLACSIADTAEPLLLSLDGATGVERWSVSPADIGAQAPAMGSPPLTALPEALRPPATRWYCNNVALDAERGRIIVPAAAFPSRNAFGAVDLATGAVLWRGELGPYNELAPPRDVAITTLGGEAYGATVTRTGIVVGGARVASGEFLFSWYDHDGRFVGSHAGRPRERAPGEAVSNVFGGSVSEGDIAVGFVSDQLLIIDPTLPSANVHEVDGPHPSGPEPAPASFGLDYALNAAIFGDTVVMPFRTAVFAYDLQDARARWIWDDPQGSEASDALIVPPDEALVIAARGGVLQFPDTVAPLRNVTLYRLSLARGEVLHRVDLGHAAGGAYTGHLVPLRDGRVALFERQGNVTLLGPAVRPVPGLEITDAYPRAGETVALDAQLAADVVRVVVGWGDNAVDTLAPGDPIEHAYAADGTHTIRVTAVYPDNRTATRTLSVDVGGTPPPDTFLARQFAAENQERSFFILGLLVTLLGVLFAIIGRRRRHSRIAEDLALLDEIRRRAGSDPADAVERLGRFRERIAEDLSKARIDDAQFSTLELAATRLLHLLRQRLLGPLAGRVSLRLEQALDLALQDGRIESTEEATLRTLVTAESQLSPGEREVLERLIATWRARSVA